MKALVGFLLLAGAILALVLWNRRPTGGPPPAPPAPVRPPPAAVVPRPSPPTPDPPSRVPLPPPPPAPRPRPVPLEIPIQDQSTIDFSPGTPVIRSGPNDDGGLERALKEMAEATKDIRIGPGGKVEKGAPAPGPR